MQIHLFEALYIHYLQTHEQLDIKTFDCLLFFYMFVCDRCEGI
jgi:hypothetical protein